jgi:hypothetical protein
MTTVPRRHSAAVRCLEIVPLLAAFVAAAGAADATPATAVPAPQILVLGDFEAGTDGFANFTQDTSGGKVGKACAKMVNPKDGWIEGGKDLPGMNHDITQLRFWAKSTTAKGIAVRLSDDSGQSFQHRLALEPNGEWQELAIADMVDGAQIWGGANDKKWHGPLRHLQLILEGGHNDISIDAVTVTLDAKRIIAPLAVRLAKPGNVFLTGEDITVPIESSAPAVTWTLTDFWGAVVAKGEEKPADGDAVVHPGITRNGYYTLDLVAHDGDSVVARRMTGVALIPPIDVKTLGDSPYGAMTHFAQGWDPDVMPILVKAGIITIRDEQYWQDLENTKGQYAYPPRLSGYMDEAKKEGVQPLVAMTFGNKLYDGGNAPATDEGRDAYANYGVELLNHYGKQLKWLEVWNEYNGSWCGGEAEKDRPKYYAEMIKTVYQKIKAARPDVQVLGCACVVIPMPYIEGIFKNGGLQAMDAVVIHPYRGEPEGVETETGELAAMIRQYNDGKDKPIWVTETGCMPDAQEGEWEKGGQMWEKSRAHVARYLARQYALLQSVPTVANIYWYLTRDYNEFKLMGLLRDPSDGAGRYDVAAPYVAYATYIRQMHGTRPTGRSATGKFTYIENYARGAEQVHVCWATVPAHVALDVAGPVTVTDLMGVEETLTPVKGQVFLTLNDAAVYVRGTVTGVHETGGHFTMQARQTVDIQDEYALQYASDDDGFAGTIEVAGKSYPVKGKAGRVVIAGEDTAKPRTGVLRYRLVVGGKPAGLGGIEVSVVDPLEIRSAPALLPGGRARIDVANVSARKDYAVTAVKLAVRGAGNEQAVAAALAHRTATALTVPLEGIEAYKPYELTTELALTGRAPLRLVGESSYNPCPTRTLKTDGDAADWQQGTAIDLRVFGRNHDGGAGGDVEGKAWIAADDSAFYLAAAIPGNATLRFALAPDYPGTWAARAALAATATSGDATLHLAPPQFTGTSATGVAATTDLRAWFTFHVGADGTLVTEQSPGGAAVHATVNAGGGLYRIAIPWSELKPLAAKDPAFRLDLAVIDGVKSSEWGRGLLMGASPDAFRICLREGATAADQPVVSAPLPAAAAALGALKPIADSQTDYSKEQGRNGWSYGYMAGKGDGKGDGKGPSGPYTDDDFQPMNNVQTMWGYVWQSPAKYNEQSQSNSHPGDLDGRIVWAVRRWTCTQAGTVRISGFFSHGKEGDGTGGRVLVDGVQVYSGLVGGPNRGDRIDYAVTVPVNAGSLIDIAVTPGPGADTSYDTTTVGAKVELVTP